MEECKESKNEEGVDPTPAVGRIKLESDRCRGGYYPQERLQNSVDYPPHYADDKSGVECIQITEHRNFCVGNAMKYLWRAGRKGSENSSKHIEDLQKAIWYCQREIQRISNG